MSRKSKALQFADATYSINVIGKNLVVTDAIYDYAIEKVSKIEKFSHRILDIAVILELQKVEQRCDIILKVGHIKVKSHASTDNIYASIDKAVDKLQSQLLRYKSRIQDHQGKSIEMMEMTVNILEASQDELNEVNDEIDEENMLHSLKELCPRKVISQEKMLLKFLTNEEAIMKMELSGDAFLIFRGEADRKIKVIYRKNDGNFAIIEPEF
ncbi:MAG TPA: ribosome-associated translation inhibitor RaiA [Parachlamydiaceae bacterium]|nr:ribosome-associated translation inhibitor RaiA [Parachlamydiaceae bacterium]